MVEGKGEGRQIQERLANSRIEQAYVGGQLGCRTDRASEVAAHLLLVYDYRRGKIPDLLHVRAGQFREPCPRKGTEGLDQLALGFGVDGIEEQGRLAAAAGAAEDDNAVLWNLQAYVFQIVGMRISDDDTVLWLVVHICFA